MSSLNKDVGYAIGQRVMLIDPDIQGTVQQILFGFDGIQYQIGYWDGTVRRVEWVFSHEIAALRKNETVENQ